MVKVKEGTPLYEDGAIDLNQWLKDIESKGYEKEISIIQNACTLSQLAGQDHATEIGMSSLQLGLCIADVLADLEVVHETLAAAILFESVYYAELSVEDIAEQLGSEIANLVKGVQKMSAISSFENLTRYSHNKHQMDNLRKMLLAMVDDVRVVLIKLAERLCILRYASHMPDDVRKKIANEIVEIYAPLANRLGIGAIKWEMEDLAFRFLHPEDYKIIAKGLNEKRLDRDRYVDLIVNTLEKEISTFDISEFDVYGRAKHIHSIYKKMVRKNISLNEIYDAIAVRILVKTTEECYRVLSLVHDLWEPVSAEYDDYIANPKENGYQSLHTAVKGPEEKVSEVQIRTFAMHELAEMGVAAHWKYKEGTKHHQQSHERKISWLRDVLSWHREMARNKGISDSIESEFLDDRVYVFTPECHVLDLPEGATALDFAYHVHTQVGHRCRGAKVCDHIVPLSYRLKTGDRVEILTGKEEKPSRDWINPHLNYLKTSRAKAKILHWFKMQDYEQNREDGQNLLEKELKNLGLKIEGMEQIAHSLHFKCADDMFAALGRNDIKIASILARLVPNVPSQQSLPEPTEFESVPKRVELTSNEMQIEGVGNLLTYMARCCQPLPGDDVIGYITLGRGISIHRLDCANIIHASEKQRTRFLQVKWGNKSREKYSATLSIKAYDRPELLRDITALFSQEKAHIFSLHTHTEKSDNFTTIKVSIEIDGLQSLSKLISKISQIPNVLEAKRQT